MFPWCAGLWGLIIGSAIAGGMAALACMADHQCSGWGILGVFIWTFATAMFTSWLGNTGAGLSKFDKIFYGLYGKIVDAGSYIMRRL
jgi:hypothetical protein